MVNANINNVSMPELDNFQGFIESNGYVSIELEHYSNIINSNKITWKIIPNLGKTLSGITPSPVTARPQTPEKDSPRLEYQLYLFTKGEIKVKTYLSPTLDFPKSGGLRYAISIDNEKPQIVNINSDTSLKAWKDNVGNNINIQISKLMVNNQGIHTLEFLMVDPGIVLQKFVIETKDEKYSYLGPPVSFIKTSRKKK
jgi:hypothetical protein